jgi:hypothetical protein
MAIRHKFTHLSEFALRDSEGRASFINLISNIMLDEVPGAIVSLYVSVAFTGSNGDEFSVVIEDPEKKAMFESPKEVVRVPASSKKSKLLSDHLSQIMLKPAIFRMEGKHHVVFMSGKKVIHKEPFMVFKRGNPLEKADDVDSDKS